MVHLSRQSWLALALAAASALFVYAIVRASSKELSIALETCQPNDSWARLSRAYDPLGFWVEQTLVLEDRYSRVALEDSLHECKIDYRDSLPDQEACGVRMHKIFDAAQRCHAHATKMCRIEGGHC